jgi:hypothetical protein
MDEGRAARRSTGGPRVFFGMMPTRLPSSPPRSGGSRWRTPLCGMWGLAGNADDSKRGRMPCEFFREASHPLPQNLSSVVASPEAHGNPPTPTPDARSVEPSASRRPILRGDRARSPIVSRLGFSVSRPSWYRQDLGIAHQVEALADFRALQVTRRRTAWLSGDDDVPLRKKFTWHPAARRVVCVSGQPAPRAASTHAYAVRQEADPRHLRIWTSFLLKERTFSDP